MKPWFLFGNNVLVSVFFQVLNRCASANWSERKEGLLGLQALLKNQRTLRSAAGRSNVLLRLRRAFSNQISNVLLLCSRVELKRLCEIFTRMFADPHSKVWVHVSHTRTHGHAHSWTSSFHIESFFIKPPHPIAFPPKKKHPSLILLDSAKERQIIHPCTFLQSGMQENTLERRTAGREVHTQIYALI